MISFSPARHRSPLGIFAASAILLATSSGALAGFQEVGGGNPNIVPLYRTYNFAGISRTGNGSFDFDDLNLYTYNSNVAPPPISYLSTSKTADGATLHAIGQAASSGFYAGRNYAQISVTNARDTALYYAVAGTGSATSVRFFDPSAAADHAVFTWHVSGTSSGSVGRVDGRLDFGATTDTTATWFNLFDDPTDKLPSITEFGPGTYTYTLPIADLGTTINLFYWSSAFTQVDPGDAANGSNFTVTANYSNTFFLETVGLFDKNNVAISDWTLKDLTENKDVFNAAGRITPLAPAPPLSSPVPEPGTSTLLVIGLVTVGFVRRRVKRSTGNLPANSIAAE